jgi:DNA-binding transcriptional MerR regulator
MYTINQLGRRYHLSRSTLLYYHRIGLLAPSGRTPSNYRLYSEKDRLRLKKIVLYRKVGLSLNRIGQLLDSESADVAGVLEKQLDDLNRQIARLRTQQHLIMKLLDQRALRIPARVLGQRDWVRLLRSAGMSDEDLMNWHRQFESLSPAAHQNFLESLGMPPEEVEAIRGLCGDDQR